MILPGYDIGRATQTKQRNEVYLMNNIIKSESAHNQEAIWEAHAKMGIPSIITSLISICCFGMTFVLGSSK